MSKKIPISAAKKISEEFEFPEVVIFAYDPDSGKQHVTTFGQTKEQCEDAAKAGNFLKKALNWPDELCHAEPNLEKKIEEIEETDASKEKRLDAANAAIKKYEAHKKVMDKKIKEFEEQIIDLK